MRQNLTNQWIVRRPKSKEFHVRFTKKMAKPGSGNSMGSGFVSRGLMSFRYIKLPTL